MKVKQTIKIFIDVIMLLLLPILMTEIMTGQKVHEWLGTVMGICSLFHIVLNVKWFRNLFKGNYTATRFLFTIVNLLLCVDILLLFISSIMMSGFVFTWLHISGGLILARKLHLFSSYWGLILMSAHFGLNCKVIFNGVKKSLHPEKVNFIAWSIRIISAVISAFGVYAVISQKLHQYLFLQTHFVFFDETKSFAVFFLETVSIFILFAVIFYYLQKLVSEIKYGENAKKVLKWTAFIFPVITCTVVFFQINAGHSSIPSWEMPDNISEVSTETHTVSENMLQTQQTETIISDDIEAINDGFLLIQGGTFQMGSPETESWQGEDELQHTVTVSDFFISPYEVTQKDYEEIMGANPSNFIGEDLPVENVSWLDAVQFCNARSEKEGLTPVYTISDDRVSWDRSANGYRLPTEAEWEYACRAGTTTPFNIRI